MINSKKIARKSAKKIKYGVFSFLVLVFGSLATASVFLIPKNKIKENDVHPSKNKIKENDVNQTKSKIDFSAKSITRYGDLLNKTIQVDYDGTNYTFQIDGKNKITSLKILNLQLNNQHDTTTTNYTIDNLPSTLTIDTTKTISRAKSIAAYGDLTSIEIFVSYDGTIKYTVKGGQKINFDHLKAETLKQGITLKEGKNTEATLDATQLKGLNVDQLAKAKAKKTSIDQYGDLTTQAISVSYDGTIKYTVKGGQKINFDQLKAEATKQGITLTTENKLNVTQLKNLNVDQLTSAQTKAKSIENFGDLTSPDNTISVSYNVTDGKIKYTVNSQVIEFDQLKAGALKQGIKSLTTEKTLNVTQLKGLDVAQLTSARKKAKSINTYGDLTSSDNKISVYYDETIKYTANNQTPINFDQLKTEATKQGITLTKGKNTEATLDTTDLKGLSVDQLVKAKAKKTSIDRYGNLTTQAINVSHNVADETIKYTVNSQIIEFDQLKAEAKNQGITLTTEKKLKNNSVLDGLVTSELTKAKSIKTYGDLTSQAINVSYDVNVKAIKYTVNSQVIEFDQLKAEALKQEITLTNEDALINSSILNGLVTSELTKAKSIKRYGNLTSSENKISVYYDGTIKYSVKNKNLSFEQLKAEATKQGITLTNGKNTEATLDATDLKGLNVDQLETAKTKKTSIENFGDFKDPNNKIIVFYNDEIKYSIKNQNFNFIELKAEATKQGITLTTEPTLDATQLKGLILSKLTKAKIVKAISIARYGDLTTQTISVSYDKTIKYTVKDEQDLNFDQLKAEAKNQGLKLTTEKKLKNNSILSGLNEAELIKAKSIAIYGDLTGKTNQEKLKITYGPVSYRSSGGDIRYMYKFEADNNLKILSFDEFNEELKKQEIRSNHDIDSLIDESQKNSETSIFVFDDIETPTNAKAKKKSIETYGDLTYLEKETLGVSYNGTNFVFQLDTKDPIIGIEAFKTQYNLQNGKTKDWKTFNQVKKIIRSKFKTDELKTVLKANSIAIYGDLTGKTNQGKLKITYGIDSINGQRQYIYKFMINNKQKILSFDLFNKELKKQGISSNHDINSLIAEYRKKPEASQIVFDAIKNPIDAITKKTSIAIYGDLTGKTNQEKLKVNYVVDSIKEKKHYIYQFVIGKNHILPYFDLFNKELKKQGIRSNYDIDSLIAEYQKKPEVSRFFFDAIENPINAKIKAKKISIARYGDLTSLTNEMLGVSYDGTDFVFQIDTKDPITGIATFKTQYNLQNEETNDWTTIDQVETKITTVKFKDDQLATAKADKAKATSIAKYGDLKTQTIFVSFDGTIKYSVKNNQKIEFNQLKTEATKQGITTFDENITEETLNATHLTGLVTSELTNAKTKKTKAKSIATYGDLRTQIINVSYDETIKYTVNNQTPINFEKLAAEALKQGITLISEAELNNSTLANLNIDQLIYAKKIKESLITYGDLTDSTNTISVSYNVTDEKIKYTVNNQTPINFNQLKAEALKQGITLISEKNTEATLDATNLKGLDVDQLTKAKIKKLNFIDAQKYFDLTNVKNASFFNKINQKTINAISKEINKINNYNHLSDDVKKIVDHSNNSDLKNALNTRIEELQTKKANLEAAKVYFDLTDVKNASFFNKTDKKTIDEITTEINKINNYDTLTNDVKMIVEHSDNSKFKKTLETKLQSLQTKKTNLVKIKNYFDLSNIGKALFFNRADDATIEMIKKEINKISDQNVFFKKEKEIINHSDNFHLKLALLTRLKELQTKKANLESAKAYFDLNIKDPVTFNNATEKGIELIIKEIDKDNFAILPQEIQEIINHNDNSDLKNALDTKLQQLRTKKINLELAKTYFDLTVVENASFFNKANDETIKMITKEINKINNYDSLAQEVKDIVDHNDNSKFKKTLETKLHSLQTKKTNLEEVKRYFNYFEPKLSIFNNDFESLVENFREKLSMELSQEAIDIINHIDNSDLIKRKSINIENFKLQLHNQEILNFFKKQKVLIDFRKKDSELFQIFLYPYKAFNLDIEAAIENQNNQKLKHLLQKNFLDYKKKQKESLKTISILENGKLLKNSLFVDYINQQFVFKDHFNINRDFKIFGIKHLIKELMLQSIVDISFFPWNIEQFEEKLINVSDKKIFFKNWEQAKQKWSLDQAKKNFLQSNNHLLNSHSQNNLFIHPSFILAFFVIIFGVDRFVKWIKKLWKN